MNREAGVIYRSKNKIQHPSKYRSRDCVPSGTQSTKINEKQSTATLKAELQ
jgi:hypothetical protein